MIVFILSMSMVELSVFSRDSSTANKLEASVLIVFILSMSKARNPFSHAIPRQEIRWRLLLVSYFIGVSADIYRFF